MVAGHRHRSALALHAFNQNLMYFYTPTQVAAGEAPAHHPFRVGGLVTKGSLKRQPDGLTVQFDVTDTAKSVQVQYKGILPDLFREGQGIVATADCAMTACSSPTKCSPSTTRSICRRRSPPALKTATRKACNAMQEAKP